MKHEETTWDSSFVCFLRILFKHTGEENFPSNVLVSLTIKSEMSFMYSEVIAGVLVTLKKLTFLFNLYYVVITVDT